MDDLKGRYSVSTLCRVLQVSASGYYAWRRRAESRRSRENRRLLVHIRAAFEQSGQTYGSPRIWRELKEQGIAGGKGRVERLMRQSGIRAEPPPRFRVTTDSGHALPVAQNLLEQDFTAETVNERWAADITYVWTRQGWLYLSVVLDLFSRRIVGWAMQPSLEKKLVLDALEMALVQRRPSAGLLHHSDRGSQYASRDFQQRLTRAGIVCSMSRRDNCACKPACAGTMPWWKASFPRSSANSFTGSSTLHVRKPEPTCSSTSKSGTTGSGNTPRWGI